MSLFTEANKIQKNDAKGKMRRLNCAGWQDCSSVNGPGIRSVLFVQGCSRHCADCQNPSTHDKAEHKVMTIQEAFQHIAKACRNKRITISGGEPLEQIDAVFELLKQLKNGGFETCLYTSNVIEDVPEEILAYLDYIKCGPFRKNFKNSDRQYFGSDNQKFYSVKYGVVQPYT